MTQSTYTKAIQWLAEYDPSTWVDVPPVGTFVPSPTICMAADLCRVGTRQVHHDAWRCRQAVKGKCGEYRPVTV
jgi:hypothetical protein